jgi:hypothetical protein
MNTAAEAALSERRMVAAGLRLWAGAVHRAERALTSAAVELVVRTRDGEFADLGWPWIREGLPSDPLGLFWLDVEAMTAWNGGRPEHPVMSFVEALAGGRPVRQLHLLMHCLDGASARLVRTAFQHVARDRRDVAAYAFGGDLRLFDRGVATIDRAGSQLLDWPPNELDQVDRPALVLPFAPPALKLGAVQ